MPKAKSKLKNVVLDEVSFVGKGDNPEAHITLLKVKKQYVQSITSVEKDFRPDGDDRIELLKDWAAERPEALTKATAESFFDLLQDKQVRDLVWDMVWTLEDSIYSIMNDDSIISKASYISQTVDQFREAITTITKGEKEMPKELQKQLDDVKKQLEEAQNLVTTVTKERDDFSAEIEVLKKDKNDDDVVIDKSKLPAAVVKQLEDQETSLKKQADDLAILKEENQMRVIVTKAAELPHIAPIEEVTKVLKSLSVLDAEANQTVFDLLKSADARIQEGSLLNEEGTNTPSGSSTASEQIKAAAKELQKSAPDLTDEQAFVKVYNSNAELRKAYNEEAQK